MPVTVLLTNTNWWPVSAHIAVSLQTAGVRVAAAYPSHGHPLGKTVAVSKRFPYSALSPLKSLTRAIRESSADWILPCDDRAAWHLHRLHAQAILNGNTSKPLADLIERSLGSPAAFPVVSARAALLRSAQAENIAVPEFCEVISLEDLRTLDKTKSYPWVMKVDGSWGGLGVKVVNSLKEAEACFHRMREPLGTLPMLKRLLVNRDAFWFESWRNRQRPGITIQSYIEGRPANCVVFCTQGKVVAGIAVEVVAAQGRMGPATIVRIIDGRQMLDAAETLVNRLKLSGFHGFDFMLEEKSGMAYLIELNPRCAMPCHLRLGKGRDLIGSLYSELSGKSSQEAPPSLNGNLVCYFPQAWLSNPKSEALRTAYHDVPWGEPQLLKELLLLPWPDRSFLAQTSDRLRNMTLEQRSAQNSVFQPLSETVDAAVSGSPASRPREVV